MDSARDPNPRPLKARCVAKEVAPKPTETDEKPQYAYFFSGSKNVQDLGPDIQGDWRKRLSNFATVPGGIKVEGRDYYSVEHAYQALKARHGAANTVRGCEYAENFETGGKFATAREAKKAGTKTAWSEAGLELKDEWIGARLAYMQKAMKARFAVDALFRVILCRVKEKNVTLVHFSRMERFWAAVILDKKIIPGTAMFTGTGIYGENHTAVLLMRLSEE